MDCLAAYEVIAGASLGIFIAGGALVLAYRFLDPTPPSEAEEDDDLD
ncbi:hypothetical protein [Nannocystis pusilla]|uniref:Uncharacterized protein n=1 Tax=Nannocystis pusilla TaxID=889268 RepID=A0ABS7U4B5_9BACT|nr:hypothetical protein [Nannocystis pusilla]MBZ5715279.1 hypothetical protein [Nannocystis pusilla]